MSNLLFISWFILFVEGLSIERSSFDENNSDQLRLARADLPPFDYYSGNNNDYYVAPELPMERYEPREHAYPIAPVEVYPNAPIRVYPAAPQEQIELRPPFDPPRQLGNYMNELQQPFIEGNGETQLIRVNSREPLFSDGGTEVDLELPNERRSPVVSYFVPNSQEPNVQKKRSEQESSEQKEANADINQNLGRSKQEMKYELEIKRDRENKRELDTREQLETALEQGNSSELENQGTPKIIQ